MFTLVYLKNRHGSNYLAETAPCFEVWRSTMEDCCVINNTTEKGIWGNIWQHLPALLHTILKKVYLILVLTLFFCFASWFWIHLMGHTVIMVKYSRLYTYIFCFGFVQVEWAFGPSLRRNAGNMTNSSTASFLSSALSQVRTVLTHHFVFAGGSPRRLCIPHI